MAKKYYLLGVTLLVCSTYIQAQTFDIKKLSTNEGLPSGQIGDLVQDAEGYIWLSTYGGLIRYDGTETKAFTTENGFRNNLIYDLFIDSSNRFWVSTQETGIGLFKEDSIHYQEEFSVLDSLSVTHINESADGRIWFSTYGSGVFIWDGATLENITEDSGLPSNTTWNIHFRENGEAWIATWAGIGIYNGEEVRIIDTDNGLSGTAAYSFAENENGTIWVSTSKGISIFNGESWDQIYNIEGKELGYIYDVFVDDESKVWIATENDGIYWLEDGEYTHINKSNGLSSNYVYSFYEDNDGRVWVATDENGVNIFRNKEIRIYETENFVGAKSVNILFNKDDEFWLGTEAGLTKFDESGNSSHYQLPNDVAKYKEIWDIDELPNGNLLVLNSNSGLFEFNGSGFTNYGEKIELPWLALKDILIEEGKIWMATESGLVKYENDTFRTFTAEDGLSDDFVWSLYKDQEGGIWAATDKGVSKITADSITSISLSDGIEGSTISQITQSPDGNYWVGTDIGFTKLLLNDENELASLTNYKLAEEFLQETQFLQFDSKGNLWQGTSGGIHFFDAANIESSEGGIIDGYFIPLQNFGKGVEMNFLASHIDSNGDVWFGSFTNGLIKYEGELTPKMDPAPKVFMRSAYINGEEKDLNSISGNELKHNENNISFNFGAFQFKDPDRMFYEYRLKGFDDEWNRVYGKTEATYTNLSPGVYGFELRAKSIQSNWGDASEIASFEILNPFWRTSWFYALAALLLAVIMFFITKFVLIYYEKNKLDGMVKKRTLDLEKALAEKEVLIKEVHHRVKNNMAVVSGLLELQGYKVKDEEARSAIENSKLRIQTMSSIHEKLYQNKTLTDIDFKGFAEDLISRISASMQGTEQEIDLHLDIRSGSLNVNTAIPCGLILNELISNCYEHAFVGMTKGNIWVNFRPYIGNRYRLEVKDDGIGISEDVIIKTRSSLGVTLIHSLTSQIKGNIEILNDEGTTVIIKLPREQ